MPTSLAIAFRVPLKRNERLKTGCRTCLKCPYFRVPFFSSSKVGQSLERGKYLRPLISRLCRRLCSSRRASLLGFLQVSTCGSECAAKGPCRRYIVYISRATFGRHHYLQSCTALTEIFSTRSMVQGHKLTTGLYLGTPSSS